MRHIEVKNCLADYLDGELDLDRRSLVDKHLEVCDACSQELLELRHAVFLLRRLPTPETPPMLVEKVVRRIQEGEASPGFRDYLRRGWDSFLSSLEPPRLTAPALGLVAGLAIVVGIGDYGLQFPGFGSQAADSDSVAQVERVMPTPRVQPEVAVAPAWNRQRPSQAVGESAVAATSERLDLRGFVPSQPAFSTRRVGGSVGAAQVAARGGQSTALAEASLRTADEWIEVLVLRPVDFAREFGGLTELEQELWVTHLGQRAAETGRLSEVVTALETSRAKRTATLAAAFAEHGSGDVAP